MDITSAGVVGEPLSNCPVCETGQGQPVKFCSNCGFPVQGSAEEKDSFDLQYKVLRAEYEGSLLEAAKGTTSLYWLSGLAFAGDLFIYFAKQESAYLYAAFLVPVIFLPLAYWSKKKPFEALLSALVIYISIIVADGVISPVTLFQGIIVKIIIIVFLFRGINSAYKAKQVRNELNQRHWLQKF